MSIMTRRQFVAGVAATFVGSFADQTLPKASGVRPIRVLVVYRDAGLRDLVDAVLSRTGYEVITAPSGQDALRTLSQTRLDVVMLRMCLPGMSGLQALDRFNKAQPNLPVIIVSGCGRVSAIGDAPRRGAATDFLPMPVDLEDMERVFRAARAPKVWTRTRPSNSRGLALLEKAKEQPGRGCAVSLPNHRQSRSPT